MAGQEGPKLVARLEETYPPESDAARSRWQELVGILAAGGVALLPTDTVYGLHARWDDAAARHRILRIKGRPPGTALLCVVSDQEMLGQLCPHPPEAARRLMARYWPGGLTLVLPAGPKVPPALTVDGTIGVRLPDHAFLRDLVRAVGMPLLSTSANPSGRPPLRTLEELPDSWWRDLDAVVDAGILGGTPSTVVRVLADGEPEVLREGAVRLEEAP
jgi:L-threonylcarbamoyladenylate synthase